MNTEEGICLQTQQSPSVVCSLVCSLVFLEEHVCLPRMFACFLRVLTLLHTAIGESDENACEVPVDAGGAVLGYRSGPVKRCEASEAEEDNTQ